MEGFTQRQTIELTQSNPVLVRDQPLVKSDVQALVWIVTIKKNGVPVDLTGATASLYCARSLSEDESGGTTYSEATVESGGEVKAVLPRDAANIPGPVGCTIRVTRDGASVAVARMAVMAIDPTGDDILDEGKRIPSLDEIMASIARCDAAAEKAESAATSVGNALKRVASAIEAANGAASDARNAAGQATSGASAAKAAATTATEAATKIDDMTITATGLAAGAAPTAELTEVDGHYNIALGLPKGDKGDTGATPQITVQVKTGEPGTAATVKQTGTAEAPVIELTIPRGDTGSIGSLTINGKTPDSAGKVELTAADVGARADDWMPTAADVGALSGTDATLTQAGEAADAQKVGEELNAKVDQSDALTLEEILASTDLTNKVAGAEAVKTIKSDVWSLKQGGFYTEKNKGNTMPADYGGFIRITGSSWPGSFVSDTYYLGVASDGTAYSGTQINGKKQVTWKAL
nr:MAG TPA: BppU domain protein [Caudoviricetes sp.]